MKASVRRNLTLLLAAVMLLSCTVLLGSCADSGENENDSSLTEGPEEDETKTPYQALEKTDCGGNTFTILSRDDYKCDFYIESYGDETNTLLDNCIYERNKVIENDYHVTLEVITGGDYATVVNTVMTQATSGAHEYDIFTGHKNAFVALAQSNYLYNMNDIASLDLENVWWSPVCRENLTVEGKTVLMVGDILPSTLRIASCECFNKKLLSEIGRDTPYEAVKQGKWTLDMLASITADVTRDANGDGQIRITDDIFGMTSWYLDVPYNLYYGAGGMFVTINDEGTPELSYNTDDIIARYEKIYNVLIGQNSSFCTDYNDYADTFEMFLDGRALFVETAIGSMSSYSAKMEQDYGVVPDPKYDERQDSYYAFINGAAAFVGIVGTVEDPEFVGTVLEGMSAYNYSVVTPNMFEIVTKYKSARDPESAEMVDIVIHNTVYDFAYYFDIPISNVVRDQLAGRKAEISSAIKSADRMSKNTLKNILKAYEKYN